MSDEKTVIVTKVYDTDCDICNHMKKHDRATFESYPELAFQEVLLDDIINHNNNLTKVRLYQCVEKYALNNDYTVDLPVYVFLSKKGKYLDHQVGAATVMELRERVKSLLSAEQEDP